MDSQLSVHVLQTVPPFKLTASIKVVNLGINQLLVSYS